MDRKRLLPYILAATILVPLIVEGGTIIGMLRQTFRGEPQSTGSGRTVREKRFGQGEEILPGTVPRESIVRSEVVGTSERWNFHLAIRVRNTDSVDYRYRFLRLKTSERIIENERAFRVSAGDRRTIELSWSLARGRVPWELELEVVRGEESGERYRIPLADPPVKTRGSEEP